MATYKEKPKQAQWMSPYAIVKNTRDSLNFYQEALDACKPYRYG